MIPVSSFTSRIRRAAFPYRTAFYKLLIFASLFSCCAASTFAQQTNPVDREVTNPITDTPSVSPLQTNEAIITNQPPAPPATTSEEVTEDLTEAALDELEVIADTLEATGEAGSRVLVREGNVDARIGAFRLQADKLTIYEKTNTVEAVGNVILDQAGNRIAAARATFNYRTKTGTFEDASGFTDQTDDGTTIYFVAQRVEKVSARRLVAYDAEVTACDEETPKWSFNAARTEIDLKERVRLSKPSFRVKGFPIFKLPYASVSIKPRDRASGFLTPTFSGSGEKGFRYSQAYYQTLGQSADITLRGDVFTARGLGIGADVRTRANSRSFLNFGFYAVKDRMFGARQSEENPNQGGSMLYVEGVQYLRNGFLAAADVNITSSLAFRQVFSDGIQLATSPEERSQVFVNRNFGAYSFNALARTNVTSLVNSRIRIRNLPSITLEKRPGLTDLFGLVKNLPVYFSFGASLEGVSRKETSDPNTGIDNLFVGELANPLVTPSIVQRLDLRPRFQVPFNFDGWTITAALGARATYYSNSVDPLTRLVLPRDVTRGYAEFEVDVRPPALARDFYRRTGVFRFRHTIEPYLTYRKIEGITDFEQIIRFDETDAIADTNELEFGITNRFFTRRDTRRVGFTSEDYARTATTDDIASRENLNDTGGQPYEALSIMLRAKYFFDPYFGGALIPGRRNQFYPLTSFSGFTYGGAPRRLSPVNLIVRYRPRSQVFVDFRSDTDVRQRGGLRALALTAGVDRRLIKIFQTFYYTRAINLAPSLARFSDPLLPGNEAGTLQGSQWSPSVFLGNTTRGLFGGASLFFDFQNRPDRGGSSLISSTTTLGYAFDCCAVTVQHYFFDVGLRQENRVAFSFRLNGIGTFGTEQIGQRFR